MRIFQLYSMIQKLAKISRWRLTFSWIFPILECILELYLYVIMDDVHKLVLLFFQNFLTCAVKRNLRSMPKLLVFPSTQCLKIAQKVSFNIVSEASYVYILSTQKLIKNAKIISLRQFFENLKLAVKQCYQTGHF